MKISLSLFALSTVLWVVFPNLGEEQAPTKVSQPQPPTAESEHELLRLQIQKIESEMTQIAQDLDAIDARMMREPANKVLSGNSETVSRVHELLQGHNTAETIKILLGSSGADARWEACLKTVKLYRRLWEKVFEMGDEPKPGEVKSQKVSSPGDESPETVPKLSECPMTTITC